MSTTVADLVARLGLKTDEGAFAAGDKWIERLKTGMAGLLGYLSYRWVKGQIEQTVELGGAISDLSQKIGVPAETLQELGYAAQLSGGSMEMLGNSLGKLSKLASDAHKGGKEAASTFKDLGVKVTGADGALRPADELLASIADKIASLPDGTEKTALAMRAFGRSGKDLIPLLNEGSEGIAKLRQEFIDLGGEIDGETADALEGFGDETDKIGVIIGGIRNQLVIGLLPYLREAVSGFIEWYKVNRQIIRQRIEKLIASLVPIFRVMVSLLKVFMTLLEGAINLLGNWARMLVQVWEEQKLALVAATAMMMAFKAASIEAAIASAAAWAIPLAAIAAILLLGEDIWVWAQGGDSVIGDIHKGLVRMFVEAIEFWVEALKDFFSWLDDKITDAANKIRHILPESLGGMGRDERFAYETGKPLNTQFDWNNPELKGIDFFSPEFDAKAAELDERQRVQAENRRDVANIPINAPITINGTGAADPNELLRQLQVKLEGIFRQAHAAVTAGR